MTPRGPRTPFLRVLHEAPRLRLGERCSALLLATVLALLLLKLSFSVWRWWIGDPREPEPRAPVPVFYPSPGESP
jgi:hypothetical protein